MFLALILQQLNKRRESKVRDLTSPEAFHRVKVERFKSDRIKASTKVGGEFPVPIQPLTTDFPIQTRKLPNGAPPIIRAFFLATDALAEGSQCAQRIFEHLRDMYLFTGAEGQERFHTEICAYTFTRSGQRFSRSIVSDNIKPVFTNRIAADLDIADISVPVAVLVKRKPETVELQALRWLVPLFERDADATGFEFVACLESRRTITPLTFELWRTDRVAAFFPVIEKPVVALINSDQDSIKGVAPYPCPVFMGAFEQLREMRLQAKPSGISTGHAIIPLFQTQKVVMNIAKVVKHIPQAFILRMIAFMDVTPSSDRR